jgi:hypothetical protein
MNDLRVPMSHETLTAVLTDIRDSVASGDSLEGNIEWLLPDEDDPQDADAMVRGGYRIGNRMGQGGFRWIGQMDDQPDPRQAEIVRLRGSLERLHVAVRKQMVVDGSGEAVDAFDWVLRRLDEEMGR